MTEPTPPANSRELWSLIHEERNKLGDLLGTLADAEWSTASLCRGWLVRDVVGHCIQTHLVTPGSLVGQWIASGFSLERRNARGVLRRRSLSLSELLDAYRASAGRSTSQGGSRSAVLGEVVIHGGDIARPLARHIDVSRRSLVAVAEFCRGLGPILHSKQRSAGLMLRASDVDWSAGAGPELSGPLLSIILAITGRSAALDDLSGEGLDTLRSRI